MGNGGLPSGKRFRTTPSRASENALLRNRIKIGANTKLCEKKEVLILETEYNE